MPIYKGSTNQSLVYYGSPNTNCLTSVPKNVNLALDPLNVNIVGSPTINNGVASGFSGSNWLRLPTIFNPGSNAWEMVIKARTPSAFSKRNWLTGGGNAAGKDFDFVTIGIENNGKPMMYITSNGTSWNIANAAISSNTLEVNTDYLFRFQFTGTQYVYSTSVDNGFNWVTQVTINSTTSIFVPTTPQAIGNTCYAANATQFWSGSIDLPNSYIKINGSTWWNGSSNTLTDVSQWTVDSSIRYIGEIPSDGTSKITSLVHTTVQPLSTGIQISDVYKGSQLVYHFGFDPITFTANSTWKVPPGIKRIRVDCVAAQGWSGTNCVGGNGGRVQCILNVTPGQILYIKVGKQHTAWNNGTYDASDIRTVDGNLNSRLVVAGAGGACGFNPNYQPRYYNGGAGGGLTGAIGGNIAGAANNNLIIGYGGGGGTQSAGGAGARFSMYLKSLTAENGAFGTGGAPNTENNAYGGYGGAGWYGGGGAVSGHYWAGSSEYGSSEAAAGGGSSYTHPTLCSEVVHTQGFRAGNGYVTISMV